MYWFIFEQLAGDALREVLRAVAGIFLCHSTAERLRQSALELARSAAATPRWNVYRAAQLARGMEAADRRIALWLARNAPVHVVANVRWLRGDADARIARLERRVEEIAAARPRCLCSS